MLPADMTCFWPSGAASPVVSIYLMGLLSSRAHMRCAQSAAWHNRKDTNARHQIRAREPRRRRCGLRLSSERPLGPRALLRARHRAPRPEPRPPRPRLPPTRTASPSSTPSAAKSSRRSLTSLPASPTSPMRPCPTARTTPTTPRSVAGAPRASSTSSPRRTGTSVRLSA